LIGEFAFVHVLREIDHATAELSGVVTLPASYFRYFGSSWSRG
jgi:hypothetical protein